MDDRCPRCGTYLDAFRQGVCYVCGGRPLDKMPPQSGGAASTASPLTLPDPQGSGDEIVGLDGKVRRGHRSMGAEPPRHPAAVPPKADPIADALWVAGTLWVLFGFLSMLAAAIVFWQEYLRAPSTPIQPLYWIGPVFIGVLCGAGFIYIGRSTLRSAANDSLWGNGTGSILFGLAHAGYGIVTVALAYVAIPIGQTAGPKVWIVAIINSLCCAGLVYAGGKALWVQGQYCGDGRVGRS